MASPSMSAWKTNPLLLTEKLVLFIGENPGVTFDTLEARAIRNSINMRVFDAAVQTLHKLKGIKRTASAYGGIKYSLAEVKKKMDPLIPWVNLPGNYPWPGKDGMPPFVMPWPEWDMSYIFMKPEEMAEYKAKLKGKAFIYKRKHEYA